MADREKLVSLLLEMKEYLRGCRQNASLGSKAEKHFWELQNAASEAAEMLKGVVVVESKVPVGFWDNGTSGIPDREKVIRAVETCFNSWIDKHRDMDLDLHAVERMKRDALELLKEQEPVRCKDCKHHRFHPYEKSPYCVKHNDWGWKDDDFCSYAERR